ncbi:hypothetical protein EDB89DRAFT_1941173, partial [Lactarius sanguifluus]
MRRVREHHVRECGTQMSSMTRFRLMGCPASSLTSTRHSHHTYRFTTAAENDSPSRNRRRHWHADRQCRLSRSVPARQQARCCCVLCFNFSSKDPEGDILGERPSHGHCGKICGCHHSYISSYSTSSAFGAEAREVNIIIFLSWRTIVHPTFSSSLLAWHLIRPMWYWAGGIAIIEKNNGEPPQEGIRLHSGIVRWFGECVPEVAFVCPQAFGEPGAAAKHCTGSFIKTHVIY